MLEGMGRYMKHPKMDLGNPKGSDFCPAAAVRAHFEAHRADHGTKHAITPSRHAHETTCCGAPVPVQAWFVEKSLTQNAQEPPSLSLTFALVRPSRHE